MEKLKRFDQFEKKFSIDDIMQVLPTEKEVEEQANGSFGYDEYSCYQERAFVSGTEWMRHEFLEKIKHLGQIYINEDK